MPELESKYTRRIWFLDYQSARKLVDEPSIKFSKYPELESTDISPESSEAEKRQQHAMLKYVKQSQKYRNNKILI